MRVSGTNRLELRFLAPYPCMDDFRLRGHNSFTVLLVFCLVVIRALPKYRTPIQEKSRKKNICYDVSGDGYFLEEIFIYFERIFFHVFLEVVFPITLMLYFYHQIGKEIVKQATITKNLPPYLNRKKRALATLRSLIFIYTICIVPARVVKFTIRFISIARQLPPEYFYIFNHIYNAANFTFYINNMVNIFVYTRMFGDFRKFLVDIVTFSCISKRRITI